MWLWNMLITYLYVLFVRDKTYEIVYRSSLLQRKHIGVTL